MILNSSVFLNKKALENLNDAKNLHDIISIIKKKFKTQENLKLLNIRTKEVTQNCDMMYKIFLNN